MRGIGDPPKINSSEKKQEYLILCKLFVFLNFLVSNIVS